MHAAQKTLIKTHNPNNKTNEDTHRREIHVTYVQYRAVEGEIGNFTDRGIFLCSYMLCRNRGKGTLQR